MPSRPHIYSIAAGTPFLPALADALCTKILYNDADQSASSLADITVFLPTRRATISLRAILANRLENTLLPNIRPLAEIGDIELATSANDFFSASLRADSVSHSERTLFLANAIAAWQAQLRQCLPLIHQDDQYAVAGTANDVFFLTQELGTILDTLTIHGISSDDLQSVDTNDQDQFWEITRNFISIVTESWPKYLKSVGLMDPLAALTANMDALIHAIEQNEIQKKIIIAGSTGSMPATARLMKAVAHSAQGRIILPGLDFSTHDSVFAMAGGQSADLNHPQAILANLLQTLKVRLEDVKAIGESAASLQVRQAVISQALQPAIATAEWHNRKPAEEHTTLAFESCAYIEAPNEQVEAKAIACSIREVMQDPRKKVAVITPDRTLAERIINSLKKWDIHAHDTAEQMLPRTQAGTLYLALAEWLASPADPEKILTWLSHPHTCCGYHHHDIAAIVQILELYIFRGRPAPHSFQEIENRIRKWMTTADNSERFATIRTMGESSWTSCLDLIRKIEIFIEAHNDFFASEHCDLLTCLRVLNDISDFALSTAAADASLNDDHVSIQEALESFKTVAAARIRISALDFARVLPLLMGRTQKQYDTSASGVTIYGLLESRLMQADRIILAGLNEQSWPPQPKPDMLLTRAMKNKLGLPLPERTIGQTAHDFVQSLHAAENVIISRSLKKNGAPTIESRFMQRIASYIGIDAAPWQGMLQRGQHYVALAEALDQPITIRPATKPAPIPSASLLPSRISVTEAETIIRDPYAFFAKKVLTLEEPKPWAAFSDAAYRGQLVHEIAAMVAKSEDARLDQTWNMAMRTLFAQYQIPDTMQIFWAPALHKIGSWFADWHASRMRISKDRWIELAGQIALFDNAQLSMTLSGRADRIELSDDGISIIDFKTGSIPTRQDVELGLSPQLTLEAAMVAAGGFGAHLKNIPIQELYYIALKAKGGGCKAISAVEKSPQAIAEIAQNHLQALRSRMILHMQEKIGFKSRRFPHPSRRESAYDHLARVAEWSRDAGEIDDD